MRESVIIYQYNLRQRFNHLTWNVVIKSKQTTKRQSNITVSFRRQCRFEEPFRHLILLCSQELEIPYKLIPQTSNIFHLQLLNNNFITNFLYITVLSFSQKTTSFVGNDNNVQFKFHLQ